MTDILTRYTLETTRKVTPTNAVWDTLRSVSDPFGADRTLVNSNEIREDNQPADAQAIGFVGDGGFVADYSLGTFDPIFEAMFRGTWTADVLKIGSISRYFSVEQELFDAARFALLSGRQVTGMGLNYSYGQAVPLTFDMPGLAGSGSSASAVGTGSTNAAPTGPVLFAPNDLGVVQVDGANVVACVQDFNLNMAFETTPINCASGLANEIDDVRLGRLSVGGTLTLFASPESFDYWATNVMGGIDVSISQGFNDGTNTNTWLLPKATLSGNPPQKQAGNAPIPMALNFQASYDSVTDTTVQLTRT